MASNVLEQAEKAYAALYDGFRTADWSGLFDLLADDVDCILPAPETGHFTGIEGREKMVAFFSQFGGDISRITESELIGKTVADDRVVFEDWARGMFFNEPYAARHCFHIMVRGEKVVGFHEYNRPLD
jgi:ketosteroid isomerase-like protein